MLFDDSRTTQNRTCQNHFSMKWLNSWIVNNNCDNQEPAEHNKGKISSNIQFDIHHKYKKLCRFKNYKQAHIQYESFDFVENIS